jgi:hypothetical protein
MRGIEHGVEAGATTRRRFRSCRLQFRTPRALEDQFRAFTVKRIEGFPKVSFEETLHLDFKTTESPDFSVRSDRQILRRSDLGACELPKVALSCGVLMRETTAGGLIASLD